MKRIVVGGKHHGDYFPDEKSFVRSVNPAKHLLKIFGDAPAHRIDGWTVLQTMDIEKYFLDEQGGRVLEASWEDILKKAFPWKDQMVIPKDLFKERIVLGDL